jgi:glyoxylase I family protein
VVDTITEETLRQLEESHLRPEFRSNPSSIEALLSSDFREFGSSGRVWDRAAIIAALPGAPAFRWRIEEFAVRVSVPGVAFTTYRLLQAPQSGGAARVTLRSSLWLNRAGRWQLAFHQGTLALDSTE